MGRVRAEVVFILFATTFAATQVIRVHELTPDTVQRRIESAADKNEQREGMLKEMFGAVGCTNHLSETPVSHEKLPNVICVLPGRTQQQIIVGAHFDKVVPGHGVADNWSGAAMLPNLFESLRTIPREHTLVFVGFAAEEKGLIGSQDYVHKLKKPDRHRISAMINLDTLGLGPTVMWLSHSDKNLADLLVRTAGFMKMPIGAVNVENVGSADSESFREAKIPAITVHSVTQRTWKVLHSHQDTQSAIVQKDYYDTYRMLAYYLAYIDVKLDEPPAKPATMGDSK